MIPHFSGTGVTLYHGDCIEVMRELPDNSVHAVVTDPPYGLEFMGKSWDSFKPTGAHAEARIRRADEVGDESKRRYIASSVNTYAAGLPFQLWVEQWAAECLRILKPGGHMLAFGGSRTWHRLAAGIEDAGFEIRDSIAWLYGSGFPKSLDVSKAIDRVRSEDRAPVDAVRSWLNARRLEAGVSHDTINKHFGHASNGGGSSSAWMTNPTSKALPTWEQWQELKNLLAFDDSCDGEVWRLNGRKGTPGDAWDLREVVGTKKAGIATPGDVGRYTVGGSRAVDVDVTKPATDAAREWEGWGTALKPAFEPIVVARKPLTGTVAANVLAHGTGALNIDATRIAHGADVDLTKEQRQSAANEIYVGGAKPGDVISMYKPGGRWPANVVLDETQAAALDTQSGWSQSPTSTGRGASTKRSSMAGGVLAAQGVVSAPGDSGGASRFFPTFRYEAKAPTVERPRDGEVAHPTVKPLDLMRWLVRLVTPKGGTVLEPFAGSGTTLEAALLEGFTVIGIEREAEYLPLIVGRITKPLQVTMFGDWDGDAA